MVQCYGARPEQHRRLVAPDDSVRFPKRCLGDPNCAEFYTSGRASNEAAFLFQLFGRAFGTNNFPDCSNMCHEPTSVGMPQSLGVGKGTVLLEDFDLADCIFIVGQNPGTNSPRMMTSLRNASCRGCTIISFNPFSERALERFQAPQNPIEMASMTSTPISSRVFQLRVGGDVAALKGIMKACIEADDAAVAANEPRVLDTDFIYGHTIGFETLAADLRKTSWESIERQSGLNRSDLRIAAKVYFKAEKAILVYGMGITQHQRGTGNVRQICNLALLRGNIGRSGAIPTCKETGLSASPKSHPPRCSTASATCLASSRRAPMATTSCLPLKRCCAGKPRHSSHSVAISRARRRIPQRRTVPYAGST
jgi:molybdopterin-dependent oxidoreductase alpha subunit